MTRTWMFAALALAGRGKEREPSAPARPPIPALDAATVSLTPVVPHGDIRIE